MIKTSAGKPSKYHFGKLKKNESTLIFDEKGQIELYTTLLHKKVCSAVNRWCKYDKKRAKIKIITRKSAEIDPNDGMWYFALRVIRIK